MKIRIRDRLFVSLSGIVLVAASAAVVTQAFFGIDLAAKAAAFVAQRDLKHIGITVGVAVVLALLGLYCFCMLFRRKHRKAGFVVQKTETGELSISIKALENLVQKCVDKHTELHVASTTLTNTRDGLIIKLRISLANGVNIPLVVNTLQKQIKQYVTACSGVDVREVQVQVDTSASGKVKDSAYTMPEETPAEAEKPEIPEATAEAEEKKRPLHQRLFGREEQPNEVPAPPAPAEAEPAPAAEAPAAEEAPAEQPAEPDAPVLMPIEDVTGDMLKKTEAADDGE